MKRLVLPVVLPCAGLAIVAGVALPQVASLSGGDAPLPVYEVARGSFVRTVMADGILEAETTTPITAPTEARSQHTIAWLAPDGRRVAQGEVLIRFDPSEAERNLLDGQAERKAAEQRMERQTVQSAATAPAARSQATRRMARYRPATEPNRYTAMPIPSAQRPPAESGSSGCSSVFFEATAYRMIPSTKKKWKKEYTSRATGPRRSMGVRVRVRSAPRARKSK